MMLINKIKKSILYIIELYSIPVISEFNVFNKKTNKNNKSLFDEIKLKHKEYIQTISMPEMAISMELSNFVIAYCLKNKSIKILDLGSGFSSYVFRLYQKYFKKNNIIVYSVDDNDRWLEKTKEYLKNQELNIENLYHLDDLKQLELNNFFDVVLLDLNFVEIRKKYIQFSANLINEKGVVIIDDIHKIEFLREIKKTAKINNYKLYNIQKNTIDLFGRFAMILKK